MYFVIWDQRYRCRVCLRRLRMPVEDRILEPHAPVRPAAHRVHLPVRPRNPPRRRTPDLAAWRTPNGPRIPTISGKSSAPPARNLTTNREPPPPMAHRGGNPDSRRAGLFPRPVRTHLLPQSGAPEVCVRPDTRVETRRSPTTCSAPWVLDKAHQLNLPVAEDNVHILRSADGLHIDVRYFVRVDLPGYTVDLHFYPGRRQPVGARPRVQGT